MSLYAITILLYVMLVLVGVLFACLLLAPAISDWRWRRGRRGREGMLR